jgi:hypothetical protein
MYKLSMIDNEYYVNDILVKSALFCEYAYHDIEKGYFKYFIQDNPYPRVRVISNKEILYVNNDGYLHNDISLGYSTMQEWDQYDDTIYYKAWYNNGHLHKIDGPAIISYNDSWYYEGNKIKVNSQEEFERFINLRSFW